MHISAAHDDRHSEKDFAARFIKLVDAGVGVIHVRTTEVIRCVAAIRRLVLLDKAIYKEWDIVHGFRDFVLADHTDDAKLGDDEVDINTAFARPLGVLRDGPDSATNSSHRYFLFTNPHVFMEGNPVMAQLMLMYNDHLPPVKAVVVIVTPDQPLPDSPASKSVMSLHFDTPGHTELMHTLENVMPEGVEVPDEAKNRICHIGSGMTALQFETYAALAIVKARSDADVNEESISEELRVGKTDVVNSSDILELYPSANIDNVGGMENLKDWVRKRALCYSDEARAYGIEPPKGIVLVGVPGSGKSLVSKAIGGVLGIPVVRLDFGKVFNSLVGSSEQRMRSALRMVESMAPVVLLADEVDKGLGGIGGGGGDSGVSMRVLGSFLTWLQDTTAPVFTVMTANNVDGLPPELMRRGRFDAIFSTSMPTAHERKEVLSIHMKMRGRSLSDFDPADVEAVVEASDGYVPSEIESAVKDALVNAFDESDEVTMQHVTDALKTMVPLSKAFATQIARMTTWAENNATPVSYTDAQRRGKRTAPRVRKTNRRETTH